MTTYTYTTRHQTLPGDLHTPVSTYLKVRDLFPQSILLESSDYHGVENNRSFIGINPIAHIAVSHGMATATYPDGSSETQTVTETYRVKDALNDFLAHFSVTGEYARYCGLYGYTTFNAVRYFEHIPVKDSHDLKTMRRTCSISFTGISSSSTTTKAKWYWSKCKAGKSAAILMR